MAIDDGKLAIVFSGFIRHYNHSCRLHHRVYNLVFSLTAAQKMLSCVMYAYQSFFDTTPLGRILNRFSQDQYMIDEGLPDSFSSVLNTFFSVVSTIVVIGFVTPWFLLLVVPLVLVYVFTQRFYVASSRELKRLESMSKSPIYAHFSETLNGTVTIRAFGDQNRFVCANADRLDLNQSSYFLGTIANRWLAVRLELIGTVPHSTLQMAFSCDASTISLLPSYRLMCHGFYLRSCSSRLQFAAVNTCLQAPRL